MKLSLSVYLSGTLVLFCLSGYCIKNMKLSLSVCPSATLVLFRLSGYCNKNMKLSLCVCPSATLVAISVCSIGVAECVAESCVRVL